MSIDRPVIDGGAWDCHAHLFGPYDRYPLAADRSYTPPEATAPSWRALLDRLGFEHGVLVHPSAYGEDLSLLLSALDADSRLRGVVVLREADVTRLRGLRERGVRAARFSHRSGAGANFAGSASLEDLIAMAPALAEAGLHAELWTDCGVLPDIAAALRALPVPVVIDHMGGFDPGQGVMQPGFQTLLELIGTANAWVKACSYRNLIRYPDFEAGRAFHRALVAANPERVLWGTDWPHLRVDPVPDAAALLQSMVDWTGDAQACYRILKSNPAALYR